MGNCRVEATKSTNKKKTGHLYKIRYAISKFIKIALSQLAFVIKHSWVILSIILVGLTFNYYEVFHEELKKGRIIVLFLSALCLFIVSIGSLFHKSILRDNKMREKIKYIYIFFSTTLFLLYYNINYTDIINGVETYPKWINKSAYVFMLYMGIFALVQFIVHILLFKNISNLAIGKDGIQLTLEKNIGVSRDIMRIYSSLLERYTKIITEEIEDASDRIIINNNIIIGEEIDCDIIITEIEREIKSFLNTDDLKAIIKGIDVIGISVGGVKVQESELEYLIRESYKLSPISSSMAIRKMCQIDKIRIFDCNQCVFIPYCMDFIDTKVCIIVEFKDKESVMTDIGNIIYSLVSYLDTSLNRRIFEIGFRQLANNINGYGEVSYEESCSRDEDRWKN